MHTLYTHDEQTCRDKQRQSYKSIHTYSETGTKTDRHTDRLTKRTTDEYTYVDKETYDDVYVFVCDEF